MRDEVGASAPPAVRCVLGDGHPRGRGESVNVHTVELPVGAGLLLRAPGTVWRALAMAAALLVLANPAMVEEERKGLPDVAVIVADQTQSQAIGDRSKSVTEAVDKLRSKLSAHKDLEVRVITVTENRGHV